jgi:hypothetical protein
MSSPLFTIGIPTFNRAEFLKESLYAAINQNYPNLQIVVSDNASSDNTESVVNSFKDSRITYHRNDSNVGAAGNFARTLELANGKYFSWLQDDDIIFGDFVSRAVAAMESSNASGYLATAVYGATPSFLYWDALYAPPLNLDWFNGTVRTVPYDILLPIALAASFAIPPVIAFETSLLKSIQDCFLNTNCPLFAERTLLVSAAQKSTMVVAPHIAGVFRKHEDQIHKSMQSDRSESTRQWLSMVDLLQQLIEQRSWDESVFRAYLSEVPDSQIVDWHSRDQIRQNPSEFCKAVYQCFSSEFERRGLQKQATEVVPGKSRVARCASKVATQLLPPIVANALRTGANFARRKFLPNP